MIRNLRRILEDWSVQSQLKARRNAMVSATALTRRLAEAREVDEFLRTQHRHRTDAQDPAPAIRHA